MRLTIMRGALFAGIVAVSALGCGDDSETNSGGTTSAGPGGGGAAGPTGTGGGPGPGGGGTGGGDTGGGGATGSGGTGGSAPAPEYAAVIRGILATADPADSQATHDALAMGGEQAAK